MVNPVRFTLAVWLLAIAQLLHWAFGVEPHVAGQPVAAAWVQVLWWLGSMVVSWIVMRAFAPKPEAPEIQRGTIPTVQDGRRFVRIYGEQWIHDPEVLAMQPIDPPDPITKKGGKK